MAKSQLNTKRLLQVEFNNCSNMMATKCKHFPDTRLHPMVRLIRCTANVITSLIPFPIVNTADFYSQITIMLLNQSMRMTIKIRFGAILDIESRRPLFRCLVDDNNTASLSLPLALLYHMGRWLHLIRCPSYAFNAFLEVLRFVRRRKKNDSNALMPVSASTFFFFTLGEFEVAGCWLHYPVFKCGVSEYIRLGVTSFVEQGGFCFRCLLS